MLLKYYNAHSYVSVCMHRGWRESTANTSVKGLVLNTKPKHVLDGFLEATVHKEAAFRQIPVMGEGLNRHQVSDRLLLLTRTTRHVWERLLSQLPIKLFPKRDLSQCSWSTWRFQRINCLNLPLRPKGDELIPTRLPEHNHNSSLIRPGLRAEVWTWALVAFRPDAYIASHSSINVFLGTLAWWGRRTP